jgi:hypothetical protein
MKLIQLTLPTGAPVNIVASKVEFIVASGNGGTMIAVPSHNNGGLPVKESLATVRQMLVAASIKLIQLTLPTGAPVHLVASKVEFFVANSTDGTIIAVQSHNNGGLVVKESLAVVRQMVESTNG